MQFSDNLKDWVVEALSTLGGEGTIVEVARELWLKHEDDFKASGDHFYTWQYEMRWAADRLRKVGKLKLRTVKGRSLWLLP
ncbi:hypothetical protein [Sphingomonas solaris]|uniref:Restriction system protein Mrr-like N-terminal domain-containing protein n=1 Tax=Alterirhizorhabdus solaris TaxID=2529389 RepID=A0A558RAD3_9SPHN|nr:hypothetical protein [Sphingomonas solaris]TVV76346.1 hypothetical protein FOY91_04755 [Sphingomonas solaris]